MLHIAIIQLDDGTSLFRVKEGRGGGAEDWATASSLVSDQHCIDCSLHSVHVPGGQSAMQPLHRQA